MKVDPRFLTGDGPEIFTGNELLVKGALEAEGGCHLLGGYPGSPIAGYFDCMAQIKDLLSEKGIRAVINNNEALAAAMLNGTQTLPMRAMIGMKSVGVHVAADALALGNLAGAHPEGGAIVLYGDDPWSDSTQVPSDSRYISKHLYIPTVEPSTPQEVKDQVDLSFKLSRMSELFVGYIVTTNLADGGGSVQCRPNQYPEHNINNPFDLETKSIPLDKRVLLPPRTWTQEESFTDRHQRAMDAARQLGLNRIDFAASGEKKPVGFITSGLAYAYLLQAMDELDLRGELPVLKFGLSYPADPAMIRELAGMCERIVVIEERRGFLEDHVRDVVLGDRQTDGPAAGVELWGKQFPKGLKGIPSTRGLHPSILIERLAPLLERIASESSTVSLPGVESLERELAVVDSTERLDVGSVPPRLPGFCPGCPHRDSSELCLEIKKAFRNPLYMQKKYSAEPMDLMFHGDIGCYTMLMFPPNDELMHDLSGMGLGGGTGVGNDKLIRNKEVVFMGDSTFFHSGQLAISQAIKLGQDITFVILDNSTTAMTGHQTTPGTDYDVLGNPTPQQDIEDVVRGIAGTTESLITRADPTEKKEYRKLLEHAFLDEGVKVIIATKECAITEGRRRRRAERALRKQKGYLPRKEYVNIDPEVCRFCLSCTEMTGCPALMHVETDYGKKMSTSLTSCVADGACERVGACSAFETVTVKRKNPPRTKVPELQLDEIPEPPKVQTDKTWRVCLTGVGGMGIGVGTQILVRAGHKEGYNVIYLDKKGLAIRNGGVVSQIVYSQTSEDAPTAIIPFGKANLLIGVDILEAARALDPKGRSRIASKDTTAAVINTDKVQTITNVMGKQEDFDPAELEAMIRQSTREDDFLARNLSRICERYLGSKVYANVMMLGFAFQKGLIPVSFHSIAWAIKDTIRADFRKNLYAFNMGRKFVVSPELFQGPPQRTGWRETLEDKCRYTIRRFRKGQMLADQLRELAAETIGHAGGLDEKLKRDIVVRLYDCLRWGGIDYARRYAEAIRTVYDKDDALMGHAATRAIIHNLAKAMLIKDPVFVAELHTSPDKLARDRERYNVNPRNGDSISYKFHIHERMQLGRLKFNLNLTAWPWMLKLLKRMKFLRRLPGWFQDKVNFRRRYFDRVQEFAWASKTEYCTASRRLGSPKCMDCMNAVCSESGCPLGNAIPTWLDLAYEGNWREAAELLHQTNNFPEFTARVCPAFCQDSCKQGFSEYPVQVQDVEKQIVDRAFEQGWVKPLPAERKTGRSVAIVGSGPAGLAAAQQLAREGHDVTVFERDDAIGGLLRYGIPDHRLEKSLIDRRLRQLEAEGVTFRTGVEIGRDMPANRLTDEFDAVLLCVGASRGRDLDLPGRDRDGVHFAMDFLRQANRKAAGKDVNGEEISVQDQAVVVVGGGLTGEDCVETALAQGAREVHQLEILPEDQSPALSSQTLPEDQAKRIKRWWAVAAERFENNNGSAVLKASKVEWVPSRKGPVMKTLPETAFEVPADKVLLAMGFRSQMPQAIAEQLGLELPDQAAAGVSEFRTNHKRVFAAGDLISGPTYVATAIDSGRKAARRVSEFLAREPSRSGAVHAEGAQEA
ncbi:MAG: glutamate synthase small subunit [Phycisphaerae bacterium]